MPQALTRMRTRPAVGVGMGMVSSFRTSGPPGVRMTAARIVLAMMRVVVVVVKKRWWREAVVGFFGWRRAARGRLGGQVGG